MSAVVKRHTLTEGFVSQPSNGDVALCTKDDAASRRERDDKLLDFMVKKNRKSIIELANR